MPVDWRSSSIVSRAERRSSVLLYTNVHIYRVGDVGTHGGDDTRYRVRAHRRIIIFDLGSDVKTR